MLTKENKILIKNVGKSKKYGLRRLIKEFPNKKWSKRGVVAFLKRLRTTGPLNEHPVADVRARRALLRTLTLWWTWYRARRINPRHTAPLDRSHTVNLIIGDDFFLFYFAVNINEQRIVAI